ncbi:S8 family peptidase [Phormidesmis sp. 146-12]
MKRILSGFTLAAFLLITPNLTTILFAAGAKESPQPTDLSYKFYNQRIQLAEKPNQLAVVFQPAVRGRSLGEPDLVKLEKVLQGGDDTRGLNAPKNLKVEVKPLGSRYAVLTLPATRSLDFQQTLKKRLEQSYIQTTLPIFQRKDAAKDSDQTIILNDEMIVSFEPGTSKSQVESILKRYDAEMVRPLRFTKNRYLVRSRTASGAGLLPVIDQLGSVTGVQSASPNFIQAINYQPQQQFLAPTERQSAIDLKQLVASLPQAKNSLFPNSLLPYQWHLDSRLRQKTLGQRTDVRAPEAWAKGNGGKDVVVAVLDSVIQWDHPDLQGSLYQVPQNLPDLMPGERYGWDFSGFEQQQTCLPNNPTVCASGDPDTRLSSAELALLKPHFQRMFQRDEDVLKAYDEVAGKVREAYPGLTPDKVADLIRYFILSEISGEFHGTWVSGVVAAKPQQVGGAVGVAPNAKILPVRVFGVGGEISNDGFIEAIGYSAARGVDVINLSFGALVPNQADADQIFAVLDENPKLMIVASSGNEDLDGSGYPAAIPGVLSVGASNMAGQRSSYSNFGRRLDVIAPGGDVSLGNSGGILTTGGTWISGFWEGMTLPKYTWGPAFDPTGRYVQVQGTSFSSPVVAGVVALMKGEDPQRQLTREQLTEMLQKTASYQPLKITQKDANRYRLQKGIPSTTTLEYGLPVSNPGINVPGEVLSIEQYYFGKGLVNASAAVDAVQQQVQAGKNSKE